MNTKTANGTGAKNDATATKDTSKGVALMQAVKPEVPNPLQERLKKISAAQKLSEKRRRLIDAQDRIERFEETMNGEKDCITLETGNRDELPIVNPEAVKKVIECLKIHVADSLRKTDSELLTLSY